MVRILIFSLLSIGLYSQNNNILKQDNISDDIYDALVMCYEETSEQPLLSMFQVLNENFDKENENNIYKYWQSYTKMFLYTFSKNISHLNMSISILEKEINIASSEEYALLAYLKAYKASTTKDKDELLSLLDESRKLAEKALKLESKNPRAFYVLSLLEYYSTNFDKKKFKSYLDKALTTTSFNSMSEYYHINWGKNLAYDLYIRYYLKINKTRRAKKVYKIALKEFPNDYLINQYYYELGKK